MRLVARNLSGERGGEPVFGPLDFIVDTGDALIVTGENGSGKSTLLRIVAGLIEPSGGAVTLEHAGKETIAESAHYLSHHNAMKTALSVAENLTFWRDFHGEPHLEIDEALEMVGLPEIGHLPFDYLSTGQKRRTSLARLLVSYRPIWLLDEPTAGLDARSERQFAGLMQAHLDDGGLIVAATHIPLGIEGAREMVMGTPT